MKSLLFVLTLILCGCEGAYKKDDDYAKGFKDGHKQGLYDCSDTTGIVSKLWDKINKSTVDSIVFKYDSIMVIHYNNSEVK